MKFNTLLMTTALVLGGGGLVHADVTNPIVFDSPLGNDSQLLRVQNETGVTNNRIGNLENRIELLESQIQTLLHGLADNRNTSIFGGTPYDEETIQRMNQWSPEDHLSKAQEKVVYSEELKSKIQQFQGRIDQLTKRPYLDTKGFKRAGLKRLMGNLQQELRMETAKLAWHKTQAERLSRMASLEETAPMGKES